MAETGDTIWIASTRDPDGKPVCELTWGPLRRYAPVADVRQAALDLVTCAAYAEMMMALVSRVGLPAAVVSQFTTDLLSDAKRTMFGTSSTLELMPAGDSKRRQAAVLLRCPALTDAEVPRDANGEPAIHPSDIRALDEMLTPDEARTMAGAWMAAAEATESDQLVAEAFRATLPGKDGALERLFGYLRKLRDA